MAAMVNGKRNPAFICCTYKECRKAFLTKRDLVNHKSNFAQHQYCSQCDVDCASYEALVMHKVASPDHTTCPIDGRNFEFSNRKDAEKELEKHMTEKHRNAKIPCKTCDAIFKDLGSVVAHVERGQCPGLSSEEFLQDVQNQHIMVKIDQQVRAAHDQTRLDALNSKVVSISVAPENPPILKAKDWPALGSSAGENGWNIKDAKASIKATVDSSTWASSSSSTSTKPGHLKETEKSTAGESDSKKDSWDPSVASDYFVNLSSAISKNSAINNTKFWRPDHPEFNSEHFFDALMQKYTCPHSLCEYQFDCPNDFKNHMESFDHSRVDLECPECNKKFHNKTALITHMDSNSRRCQIRKRPNYGNMLQLFTGGHIDGSEIGAAMYVKKDPTPIKW